MPKSKQKQTTNSGQLRNGSAWSITPTYTGDAEEKAHYRSIVDSANILNTKLDQAVSLIGGIAENLVSNASLNNMHAIAIRAKTSGAKPCEGCE